MLKRLEFFANDLHFNENEITEIIRNTIRRHSAGITNLLLLLLPMQSVKQIFCFYTD